MRYVQQQVPAGTGRLLDIGCSWGDDAAALAPQCREVYGVDTNEAFIAKARLRHPNVHFQAAVAESLPFADGFFDVAIASEVLEHVTDEIQALEETWRVLTPRGRLILTVPHRGLFAWLDPANVTYHLGRKTYFHRHYTIADIMTLLDRTHWRGHYHCEHIIRHGLVIGPATGVVRALMARIVPPRIAHALILPLQELAQRENRINFGAAAYQLEMVVQKTA